MKAKPSACTGEGTWGIPPSPWGWEQQSIHTVRIRDTGTVVRASRDSVSDGEVSAHTSQRFAEKPAWGHCSLLADSSKTSSQLCLMWDASSSSQIPQGCRAPFQWQTQFEGSGECLSHLPLEKHP